VMKNNLHRVKHLIINSRTNFIIQTIKLKITFARLYMKYLPIYSCTVEPAFSVPQFTVFPHLMLRFKDPISVPFFFFFLVAPALEHRAEFPQFLNEGQSVGLLGQVISSSQGLYLYTNTEKH
jgi:hypothetical protein